ncbi:MAG: hypothetical protein IKC37_05770 [Clostridia bacterium]|nr:hypothetical protein [Clostridia bacterium]
MMIWIWAESVKDNGYLQFKTAIPYKEGKAILRISADYKYVAYVNGQFVSCGQYADLPAYKSVDEVDVTDYLRAGDNELLVTSVHMGTDFAVSRTMTAGLAFEVVCDGKVIASSNADTLCREHAGYQKGDIFTPQIGFGYQYDFTKEEAKWGKCRVVETGFNEMPRPIKKLNIADPEIGTVCAQGIYQARFGKTVAEVMQNAWLSTLRFNEMTGKDKIKDAKLVAPVTFTAEGGDGTFAIVNLGKETCGHLTLSVTVDKPCKAMLGWGEHLTDLRVRTERAGRNFGIALNLKAGENVLDDYLYRMGAQYLTIFVENTSFTLNALSLRETVYPFKKVKRDFKDRFLNKIYETGVRTLELCAHEHYEDCPWREQALYGGDSRSQMLFGYSAFEEYDYPRASLLLFARSMNEDGLIELCAPARAAITIPSFTAYWLIAICDNAEADYNEAFVKEILPYTEKALAAFMARSDAQGANMLPETRYWNFHEWCDGLDGGEIFREKVLSAKKDGPLTVLLAKAAKGIAALEAKIGNAQKAAEFDAYASTMQKAIAGFYDEEKGLYASYIEEGKKAGYHAYMQALAICEGDISKERIAALANVLKAPEGKVVDCTYSTLVIKYEAIIKADGNADYCVEDICKQFGGMILQGATSYWETALGEADFDDAGSLCHGWSSVACYIFAKYLA